MFGWALYLVYVYDVHIGIVGIVALRENDKMKYSKKETSDDAWIAYVDGTKTVQEVAEHFNVQVSSARSRASDLHLKFKRELKDRLYIELNDDEVREYAETHSINEMAIHFGVTYTTLRRYCLIKNIPLLKMRNKNGQERVVEKRNGEVHEMIKVLGDHFSYASIGRVFGYSKERIRQICQEGKQNEN